ncbi:MAG TPA: response regulator transcription factor, partial [Candidatus Dormibacteraeota bacterium]|nr:response regulator transcription factor [Candidatus Dormibacteraeota bacterium]
ADDYLPKPFSPAELVERVRAILRRVEGAAPSRLVLGELTIDLERHRVEEGGRAVELSPAEYQLLVAVVRAQGRVLTREQLLDELHGLAEAEVLERAVDVHMSRLRAKLADPARTSRYIVTVRGSGYRAATR